MVEVEEVVGVVLVQVITTVVQATVIVMEIDAALPPAAAHQAG